MEEAGGENILIFFFVAFCVGVPSQSNATKIWPTKTQIKSLFWHVSPSPLRLCSAVVVVIIVIAQCAQNEREMGPRKRAAVVLFPSDIKCI